MGLFKHKKEGEGIQGGLPDLPPLPEESNQAVLPRAPERSEFLEIDRLPELPSLKPQSFNEKPEQSKIKSILNQQTQNPIAMKKSEFEPLEPMRFDEETPVIPKFQERPVPLMTPQNPVLKKEPIYVRLDKFQMTAQAFGEIKQKISEMERLLAKTKEIKQKEEKEIEAWEREIQIIKSRIDSIDQNIFGKLD